MKSKNLIYIIVIMIGTFYLTGYPFAAETKKEEVKKIYKTVIIDEGLYYKTLTAEPGTTVIWVNYSKRQVEILFLDKKVIDAADCLSNFFIGKDGACESVKMCRNCTASLCFQKKGAFGYIVKESRTFYGTGKEYRGVIWIK